MCPCKGRPRSDLVWYFLRGNGPCVSRGARLSRAGESRATIWTSGDANMTRISGANWTDGTFFAATLGDLQLPCARTHIQAHIIAGADSLAISVQLVCRLPDLAHVAVILLVSDSKNALALLAIGTSRQGTGFNYPAPFSPLPNRAECRCKEFTPAHIETQQAICRHVLTWPKLRNGPKRRASHGQKSGGMGELPRRYCLWRRAVL